MATDTQNYDTDQYINKWGHHDSVLKSHMWRTADNSCQYLVPTLKQMASENPNLSLLDIGCGPGSITVSLAQLMPSGKVTGLDVSEGPLATARQHAEALDVHNTTFTTGDAYALPFSDASFDIVHAHQVLGHLEDRPSAIKEMLRVAKPGGLVALREGDVPTTAWYPPSQALTRWHEIMRKLTGEYDAGRKLKSWCRAAGVDSSKMTASAGTWCYSSFEDRVAWGGPWIQRVLESQYATGAVEKGLATREVLREIADAWAQWIEDEDGWLAIMHGQMLIRV